jgi:NAD(P)-dependent dehydrogenase (short-subunit alcohol dehydrogenase family)
MAKAAGRPAVALPADLLDPDRVSSLFEEAAAALGSIDILVNSASVFEPGGALDTDLATWERHLRINLTAPFLLCQAFARHRAGRPGVIVNILDWRALRPGPDHFAYTISKAALASMTKSLAISLAPAIRVNGLALGAILPPSTGGAEAAGALERVPAGRWGTVDEAVQALLFLIAGSDFVTGTILHVDGGRQIA